jgi:hypothetical protein
VARRGYVWAPLPSLRGTGQDVMAVSNALIAEYTALRAEIGRFQDHGNVLMQFTFATLVGVATVLAAIASRGDVRHLPGYPRVFAFALGAAPSVYFVLACSYSHSIHTINTNARYIEQVLRVKFEQIAGVAVWDWEQFLAAERRSVRSPINVLFWLRWLVFLMPMTVLTAALAVSRDLLFTDVGLTLFVIDVSLLVLAVVIARLSPGGGAVLRERPRDEVAPAPDLAG